MTRRKAFLAIGLGLAAPFLAHMAADAAAGECIELEKPELKPEGPKFIFFDDGSQCYYVEVGAEPKPEPKFVFVDDGSQAYYMNIR